MRGIVRLAFVAGSAVTLAAGVTVGALGQLARWQAVPAPTPTEAALGSRNELRGLTLFPCDLPTASFTTCTLVGDWRSMSFRGVNLWECDLSGARLEGADLSGCTYDRFTRWSAGFEPQKHGARLVE